MSESRATRAIKAKTAQEFLEQAARYFQKRSTGGEDMAHWSNVTNSENCRAIADLIERQAAIIDALVEIFVDTTTVENPEQERVVIEARALKQ